MLKDKIFVFLVLGLIVVAFFYFDLPHYLFKQGGNFLNDAIIKKEPVYSKGIYITFHTAGSSRIDELIRLVEDTELNTVVIDIKNYTGRIPFDTDSQLINEIGSERIWIKDIQGLIDKLQQKGIYTIARIAVFEDNFLPRVRPYLGLKTATGNLWTNFKGLTWLDPASKDVWKYTVALAKEAARIGFDEINLDYVRFPSDGNLANVRYPFWDVQTPKEEVFKQFFEYFDKQMKPLGVYTSADLFGLTLTHNHDLNIGQFLEYAIPYFDYICPMVYPSHYPLGHRGLNNPAAYPYEIIYYDLVNGIERIASASGRAKLRPWLQDFDLGAHYDAKMIKLEKQAVYDAGAFGWLLWNPRNIYTEEALLKE